MPTGYTPPHWVQGEEAFKGVYTHSIQVKLCQYQRTYQMLVLSLYPTTAWQPRALAWDLISCRISSHQASRVSGSSAKTQIWLQAALTELFETSIRHLARICLVTKNKTKKKRYNNLSTNERVSKSIWRLWLTGKIKSSLINKNLQFTSLMTGGG